MSRGNRHKAQGTAWERYVGDYLAAHGIATIRLAEGGSLDPGDLLMLNPEMVVEARDRGVMNIHGAVQRADLKAVAVGYSGAVVVWKRKEMKQGNVRRTTVGVPVVAMSLPRFAELIERLHAREPI